MNIEGIFKRLIWVIGIATISFFSTYLLKQKNFDIKLTFFLSGLFTFIIAALIVLVVSLSFGANLATLLWSDFFQGEVITNIFIWVITTVMAIYMKNSKII